MGSDVTTTRRPVVAGRDGAPVHAPGVQAHLLGDRFAQRENGS